MSRSVNYEKKLHSSLKASKTVHSRHTALQKSGALTVLIEMRDFLTLKLISNTITLKKILNQEAYENVINAMNYINNQIASLTRMISLDRKPASVYAFYTDLFREYLSYTSPEKKEIREPSKLNDLKNMEFEVNALKSTYLQKELEENEMCNEITLYLILKGYENRYLEHWNMAKIELTAEKGIVAIQKLMKAKEYYQFLILREQITFESQIEYLNIANLKLKIQFEDLNKYQDTQVEKYDALLDQAEKKRNEIYHKYEAAEQALVDHRAWVKLTRETDATIVLQRRWRLILLQREQAKADKEAMLAKKLREKQKLGKFGKR